MNRSIQILSLLLATAATSGALGSTKVAHKAPASPWLTLKNPAPDFMSNCLLLFDGSLLVQAGDTPRWYRFYPDAFGNYQNGTWVTLPPTGSYGPLYYSSQLLPDGRVLILGGEYDDGVNDWTNEGRIFDPSTNTFSNLSAPPGWSVGTVGDIASIALPNGNILCERISDDGGGGIYNYQTNAWTVLATGGKDNNDEEGLTLLPNGKVLCVSTFTTNAVYFFDPSTNRWGPAASTPYNLVDTTHFEIGPAVVRPDGTMIQFGGNGSNAVYNTLNNTWSSAPSFPVDTASNTSIDCADAPAVLLPSGNVLVEASPGYTQAPSTFYEFDGTNLNPVTPVPGADSLTSFQGIFLMLPTGQAFYTTQSNQVSLYNPTGTYNQTWAPTISTCPPVVRSGQKFLLTGKQLTGLSGCSAYGDDQQNQTNYPMIRLTNGSTGHVYYCTISNLSTRAIATGNLTESVNFTVPPGVETGAATIQVVTNGIPSLPKSVVVGLPLPPSGVSVYQGTSGNGSLASILTLDGAVYSTGSIKAPVGQEAAIEVDYSYPAGTSTNGAVIGVDAKADSGVTGQIYAYNYSTNNFDLLAQYVLTSSVTHISTSASGTNYVSSAGKARFLVRGVRAPHVSNAPFRLGLDYISVVLS